VVKPVAPGQVVSGFPAMDHALERRILVAQQRSPELIRRVRQLEREVEELKKKLHE
jgi:UDP-3-O-[3-hydroxymyristoyl] glucosamine N-acyltransferase